MQQAVQTAQIDEHAEVGDVLDDAFAKLADFDLVEDLLFAGLALLFDELAPRDHDVAVLDVDLENFALDFFADEPADVAGFADIDLRGGQKDRHADIDEQAALDPADDLALDDVAFLLRVDDVFPAADRVGLALAQQDQSAFRVRVFEQDFDLPARGDVLGTVEFAGVHHAFALEAHLDDHVVADLRDDGALEDGARQPGIDLASGGSVRDIGSRLPEHLTDLLLQLLVGQPQLVR